MDVEFNLNHPVSFVVVKENAFKAESSGVSKIIACGIMCALTGTSEAEEPFSVNMIRPSKNISS